MRKTKNPLKARLLRVIIGAVLLICAICVTKFTAVGENIYLNVACFLAVYFFIGWDILFRAVKNIAKGKLLDENFLMCIATVGAFIIGEYLEAVAVMLFYQTGELFQSYAVGKSREGVKELMSIAPETATVLRGDEEFTVAPDEVQVGETIVVKAGERIALDGVIVKGEGSLDLSALTGESVPRRVAVGDETLSGGISLNGVLYIKTTREFCDSTVSRILDMVENASMRKAKTENFITKFSRYYTPAVCAVALLVAVIPSLITGAWSEWVFKALSLLVISCPCALVISVPMGFFGGIGSASRRGILVKGGGTFEALCKTTAFVFDKTGTITKGKFSVCEIKSFNSNYSENELLALAAVAEKSSIHPLAEAIVAEARARGLGADGANLQCEIEEIAGKGVIARGDNSSLLCGSLKLLRENGVEVLSEFSGAGSVVYLAKDGKYIGYIVVADEIKPTSARAIKDLNALGAKTFMLTGDGELSAAAIARESGVNGHIAGLLPDEKVRALEKIIAENGGGNVCFTGDGINDAPVIMRADVGVAMGGVGSDSAIEAADIVLMHDDLSALLTARSIAKKTLRVVKQNIVFALAIKFGVLILALIGVPYLMWFAVFADVGVSVLAILNSMRCLSIG